MLPYKDDNPTSIFPYVTVGLIVLNVVAFFLQLGVGQEVFYRYGAIPALLLGDGAGPPQPIAAGGTVLTSMFMHGGLLHLGGNMLYLWIFGNNIEDALGHGRFAVFYILGGVIATYAHALSAAGSTVPVVGASGAVSAVLGAYLLLYPHAKVHTLIFLGFFVTTIRLPALIVIGFWAIIQLVNGLPASGGSAQGGVAWFAHIGGFVFGVAAIRLFMSTKSNRYRRRT